MKKALLLVCLAAAVALASTKSFVVKLYQPSIIGSTELKPGEYKIEVGDQKVMIKHGKEVTEAPAKVETGDAKYSSTTVRYAAGDGKYKIEEIRIGGTNMKLVLD